MEKARKDVTVSNQGSVWLFTPKTRKAKAWVEKHLSLESWQKWPGRSFAVDWRCGSDIVVGMRGNGLAVGAAA